MDEFDFWRLADSFTLPQAALLIAEEEPSNYQGIRENETIYSFSFQKILKVKIIVMLHLKCWLMLSEMEL